MTAPPSPDRWMTPVLVAAGLYNLAWGALVVALPSLGFELAGLPAPRYPEIWQCVGMIVGVYGVGYLIAAAAPYRHWPIVLVGLLGKVLGPAGFLWAASRGQLPWVFGLTIITNDLLWWLPFALVLRGAWRAHRPTPTAKPGRQPSVDDPVWRLRLPSGRTLGELSETSGVMLVLLRHLGCTFCREALTDVARRRATIEAGGTRIVLVHMGDDGQAAALFRRYGLDDLERVSDPDRRLYRAFGLRRGRAGQLFGPRVVLQAAGATLRGHLPGRPSGDGLQMPGVVLVLGRRVVAAYRHALAGDRPDYAGLAESCVPATTDPEFEAPGLGHDPAGGSSNPLPVAAAEG